MSERPLMHELIKELQEDVEALIEELVDLRVEENGMDPRDVHFREVELHQLIGEKVVRVSNLKALCEMETFETVPDA